MTEFKQRFKIVYIFYLERLMYDDTQACWWSGECLEEIIMEMKEENIFGRIRVQDRKY